MNWLTANGTTKVHVKSVVNGFESEWSELVDVPKAASGISPVIDVANNQQEYYSIDGIRLQQPQKGLILIKKGNKVKKYFIAH